MKRVCALGGARGMREWAHKKFSVENVGYFQTRENEDRIFSGGGGGGG